jgi:hypothetical protein
MEYPEIPEYLKKTDNQENAGVSGVSGKKTEYSGRTSCISVGNQSIKGNHRPSISH